MKPLHSIQRFISCASLAAAAIVGFYVLVWIAGQIIAAAISADAADNF